MYLCFVVHNLNENICQLIKMVAKPCIKVWQAYMFNVTQVTVEGEKGWGFLYVVLLLAVCFFIVLPFFSQAWLVVLTDLSTLSPYWIVLIILHY